MATADAVEPVARAGAVAAPCAHCGLAVPSGSIERGAAAQFCCAGCRTVYELLQTSGLGRYYELRSRGEAPAGAGRASGRAYAEFDEAAFQRVHVRGRQDGRAEIDLYLEGVHCAACIWLVERLPRALPGVIDARLDARRSVARVVFEPALASPSQVARALDSLGYPCHPSRGVKPEELRRRESRAHLLRVGVAGACAGNVMLIAFALYGGGLHGMAESTRTAFRLLSLAFTAVALAVPGRVFFQGALSSLRARSLHMDVPVALALALGTFWGALNTLRGVGEVYFESLTAVIFLLLVGRLLQFRHQRAAADAVEMLFSLTPSNARLVDAAGVEREVTVESLLPGQLVRVRANDSVPADGIVEAGESRFDRGLLTGESRPVAAGPGDPVDAGTVNVGGAVLVRVAATGAATRVGRLMQLVEEHTQNRPPLVRLADRVAHRFVFGVLAVTALTAVLWSAIDPARVLEQCVALLIVTCPCALGLATPLAFTAAIGRAARRGILIKGGEALELLAEPDLLLLDKTGTLTRGRPAVVAFSGDPDVQPALAALEAGVEHPLARAIREAYAPARFAERAALVPGHGVEGAVDGIPLAAGAPGWIAARTGGLPEWAAAAVREYAGAGHTPLVVERLGAVAAVLAVGDALQQDAARSLERIARAGFEVRVLSGDHAAAVAAVARAAGIAPAACEGGATPERKLEVVKAERARGRRVVMVGDGVNDAAALAAADVGVAVKGGAEASLQAADVFLTAPGLEPVAELFTGAARAVKVVRRNFATSLFYNAIAGGLAVTGLIHPIAAAALMPLSSLTVLTLSWRSRTFGGDA